MHARRTALTGIVVVAMSASLIVPVMAQDTETTEAADVLVPATVAGTSSIVKQNQVSTSATGEPPLAAVTENYGWTMRWETDDPRLSGEFETNQNVHAYGAGVALRNGIGHLTNEGGSWVVEFEGFSYGDPYIAYFVNHLVGEGGYDGLSAIALAVPAAGAWEITGVIAPGPLPEPPEWVLPPTD